MYRIVAALLRAGPRFTTLSQLRGELRTSVGVSPTTTMGIYLPPRRNEIAPRRYFATAGSLGHGGSLIYSPIPIDRGCITRRGRNEDVALNREQLFAQICTTAAVLVGSVGAGRCTIT